MGIKEFLEMLKGFSVQDFEHITYAMIKPDAMVAKEEILSDIESRGFEILFHQEHRFSKSLAQNFYSEHKERPFFGRLVIQMTDGPVEVLILRKYGDAPCYQLWRDELGATNPKDAAEDTLRYIYAHKLFGGCDAYINGEATNGFHGADCVASVIREIWLVSDDMSMAA